MSHRLTVDLANILAAKYNHGFHVPAEIDISTLLEFGDDDWQHEIDIDAMLEAEHEVALIWSVSDVQSRRPDLNEEQAWRVLTTARDDFRTDSCHLDFLESTADGLFPIGSEALQRLRLRIEHLLKQLQSLPEPTLSAPDQFEDLVQKLSAIEQTLSTAEASYRRTSEDDDNSHSHVAGV
jgi:hypothetical protein